MPSVVVNGASRHVTAMTFLQAAGVAMIPSLVWGWFFVSRNPESRQLVVVTFLLGTLAVVPLLLFMAGLGVQLQSHEAAAVQRGGQILMQQALSMLALPGGRGAGADRRHQAVSIDLTTDHATLAALRRAAAGGAVAAGGDAQP